MAPNHSNHWDFGICLYTIKIWYLFGIGSVSDGTSNNQHKHSLLVFNVFLMVCKEFSRLSSKEKTFSTFEVQAAKANLLVQDLTQGTLKEIADRLQLILLKSTARTFSSASHFISQAKRQKLPHTKQILFIYSIEEPKWFSMLVLIRGKKIELKALLSTPLRLFHAFVILQYTQER